MNPPLKIKKPSLFAKLRVVIRRRFQRVKARLLKFFSRLKSAGRPKKPVIKVNTRTPPENGRRVGSRSTIKIKPASGLGLEAMRERLAVPPIPLDSGAAEVHTTGRLTGVNINIADGIKLCQACGEPLKKSEALARCLKDINHTIHRRCVGLMKQKCPHCGGTLSTSRR